jgi:hypothetical protein
MFETLQRHPMLRDLLDTQAALQETFYSRSESANTNGYIADSEWEDALHRRLGIGPFSFHGWNDGDAGFVGAIWCLIRHVRPINAVETGVAHGMTSRFILEALETIGAGKLWSIDLPPLNPMSRREVGVVVHQTGVPIDRWTYIAGTSRRRLPALLVAPRPYRSVHSRQHAQQPKRDVRARMCLAISVRWRCPCGR